MNQPSVFPRDYKLQDAQWRSGAESRLQLWKHKPTGTVIVNKVIRVQGNISREAHILQEIHAHRPRNIVGFLCLCLRYPADGFASILLEYCPLGDLRAFQKEVITKNIWFSSSTLWTIYYQLAAAVAFLHEGVTDKNPDGIGGWKPIVHCDIKPANVLVKKLERAGVWASMQIRLGDFGYARHWHPTKPDSIQNFATSHYWPPEVTWMRPSLSCASDVWALGAIIHELGHGFGPIVSPRIAQSRWYKTKLSPYPAEWPRAKKDNFWEAVSVRVVVPLYSMSNEERNMRFRIDQWAKRSWEARVLSYTYSKELSWCMMEALEHDPRNRFTARMLSMSIHRGWLEWRTRFPRSVYLY